MNNITEITKRSIFELFKNGYTQYDHFFNRNTHFAYHYYGRLSEIEFLKKLYPLDKMPGKYEGYENAEQDIIKHTIANDDYEFCWVFNDERFELKNGDDTKYLNFICAIFHPENRDENGKWYSFLERVNDLIKQDGYELYEEKKISGKSVYSHRNISPEEVASKIFIPYSLRNKNTVYNSLTISKNIRREIYNLFKRHNETQLRKTETNFEYTISSLDALIEDIKVYYNPKAFNTEKKYIETNNSEQFIMNNYPYKVFDAIELFAQYDNYTFHDEINLIFKNNNFPYKLAGSKIEKIWPIVTTSEIIKEEGVKELITQAISLYRSNNISDKQIAVEKLWDAFERLKTYYGSGNKKRSSVEKLIDGISNNNSNYKTMFENEFSVLTKIGNDYRIRHHEMNKIDIIDNNYYDYFFQRCYALIDLLQKYLK